MKNVLSVRRPGRLLAALFVLLLSAWLLWLWLRPAPPPAVVTTPVVRGNLEQTVEATGIIKPTELVSVGAQVSGRIEALDVALGDQVSKGDLIARIDSRTQQNALKVAQETLRNAEASRRGQEAMLKLYQQGVERQQRLRAGNAGTEADYQQAVANLASTRAQISALDATIAQLQTKVDTAQTNLDYTRITAPMDGTVLAVVSKAGQTVNANQSAPTIVILGDLHTMTVYAQISEADVVRTKVGQPVYFTLLGDPDTRYTSTLRKIAPAPESVVNEDAITSKQASNSTKDAIYYYGIFDIANPDNRLRTYMTAQVSIVLAKAKNALLVPTTALVGAQDKTFVQVLDSNGKLVRREVEVALDNGVKAAIASGLKAGERVAVVGQSSPGGRQRGM